MANGKKKTKIIAIIGAIIIIFGFCFPVFMTSIINSDDYETYLAIRNITTLVGAIGIYSGIILLIVAGILFYIYRKDVDKPKNIAKKILYERYAKGEITKEEFEAMKKDIEE